MSDANVYDSSMCGTGIFYSGYVALACGTWCYDVVCGIGMCYMVLVCATIVSCVSEKNLWNWDAVGRMSQYFGYRMVHFRMGRYRLVHFDTGGL